MKLILQAAWCLLLTLLLSQYPEVSGHAGGECQGQADIVFLLDSSGSVGRANFRKVLSFVKSMAWQFHLGPKDVRIGVATFANFFRNRIRLSAYTNHASFNRAVDRIPYSTGSTNTARALTSLRVTSFSRVAGHRPGVAKVAVVVTDGKSSSRSATSRAARRARRDGIHLIAVGIGSAVSLSELRAIASNPDSKNVFRTPSFSALSSINSRLSKVTCEEMQNTVRPPVACQRRRADVVFLLDASTSVGCVNFDRMLKFVQNIAGKFRLGAQDVRIGVATFASRFRSHIQLKTYSSHYSFNRAVKAIPYSKGSTNTARALTSLRVSSFSRVAGHRPGVAKVAVVVTDGKSNSRSATSRAASRARRDGIHLIAVGVGSKVNVAELKSIASNPDSRNVFTSPSFSALTAIRGRLSKAVCRG